MKSFLRYATALMLAMVFAGCETVVSSRDSNTATELNAYFGGGGGVSAGPSSPRPTAPGGGATATVARPNAEGGTGGQDVQGLWDATWADPCAANLDEITGALLSYFSVHKQLPPNLESIPKISPAGVTISLTCPVSGKRYLYHPEGLKPPLFTDQTGESRVGGILILFDSEPSHEMVQHLTDGTNDYDVKKAVHLGIVMQPRTGNPNQPLAMSVERIEPGILEMYLRANPAAAMPPTPAAQPAAPVW
jgi:hypothetical protein